MRHMVRLEIEVLTWASSILQFICRSSSDEAYSFQALTSSCFSRVATLTSRVIVASSSVDTQNI